MLFVVEPELQMQEINSADSLLTVRATQESFQ